MVRFWRFLTEHWLFGTLNYSLFHFACVPLSFCFHHAFVLLSFRLNLLSLFFSFCFHSAFICCDVAFIRCSLAFLCFHVVFNLPSPKRGARIERVRGSIYICGSWALVRATLWHPLQDCWGSRSYEALLNTCRTAKHGLCH